MTGLVEQGKKSDGNDNIAVQEPKISVVTSEEDLHFLVSSIVSELAPRGFPEGASKTLEAFLQFTFAQSAPQAIGIVERQEGHAKPILDIFLLWSSPVDVLSEKQNQEIEEIGEKHDQLARSLSPVFDSALHIIDPRGYLTLDTFATSLLNYYSTTSVRPISCIKQGK